MSVRTFSSVSVAKHVQITRTITRVVAVASVLVIAYYVIKEMVEGIFIPSQFFSYFTVQTGLLFALVELLRIAMPTLPQLSIVRLCATLYAVMIAPIYWGIVEPYGTWQFNNWWLVIHLALPVIALASWIVDPPRETPRWYWPLVGLTYPLVFALLSLLRGALTGWYPYDFLDYRIGGMASVWLWIGLLLVGVALLGGVLAFLGKQRRRLR